jgi:hypothetical protein
MKISFRQWSKAAVLLLFISAAARCLAADPDAEQMRKKLVATWIVEIQGEARTRTMNIRDAEKKQDGTWVLDATYGWSDSRQTSVKAELTTKADQFRLELTTQANSVIVAQGSDLQKLTGTFTARSGAVKPVTLEQISADTLAKRVAANRPAIIQATPDVPAECAALIGGWTGHWGMHGGEQWLWVVEVNAACVAKYQIGRTGYWGPFDTAVIQKGVLTTAGAQGGTINWERHGDELWASYSGPGGISTSAVHKKVEIGAK